MFFVRAWDITTDRGTSLFGPFLTREDAMSWGDRNVGRRFRWEIVNKEDA